MNFENIAISPPELLQILNFVKFVPIVINLYTFR